MTPIGAGPILIGMATTGQLRETGPRGLAAAPLHRPGGSSRSVGAAPGHAEKFRQRFGGEKFDPKKGEREAIGHGGIDEVRHGDLS